MATDMLKLRNQIKKKKPNFLRQCAGERKKVKLNWRRPRGLQSKMRQKLRGHLKSVSVGYKSPVEVRGLDRSGLKPVVVNNVRDLAGMDKRSGVVIASGVGRRNKVLIIEESNKKGLKVLNFKETVSYVKKVKEDLALRQKSREALLKSRNEKERS